MRENCSEVDVGIFDAEGFELTAETDKPRTDFIFTADLRVLRRYLVDLRFRWFEVRVR